MEEVTTVLRATKTMHIDVEPERVLSFLVESTVTMPDVTTEPVYESPAIAGNSYEWSFKMLGMPRKGVTVLTDYVPGERLAFRNFGAFEGNSTWTVEPEDGGSKATIEMEARIPVPLVSRFLDPLVRREWEKALEWGRSELEKQPKAE